MRYGILQISVKYNNYYVLIEEKKKEFLLLVSY